MEVFPAKPLAAPTPISPGHQAALHPTDTNSRLTACLSGHPWSFSSTYLKQVVANRNKPTNHKPHTRDANLPSAQFGEGTAALLAKGKL